MSLRILFIAAIALAFICGVPVSVASAPVQIKCGTAQAAQRWITQRASGRMPTARVAAASLSARTFFTTHFAFHYSLAADVNRVKLVTQDASLKREVDSILQSQPAAWTATQRASSLHAVLDSIGAPQPLFVQRAAIYFERAHAYYVDSLQMLAPTGGVTSDQVFNVPSDGSRFTVDIADVGAVDFSYSGQPVYGLTYPPQGSNPQYILLDNDFLYAASWNSASQSVVGTPLQSFLNDQLLYDYTVQWDLGIKITASHEFYHGIQYRYTPSPSDYHAWYELSAVGMEERLVPESEDYFQYLPSVLQHHETVSLLTGPPSTENYGNATFHQFLTLEYGRAFDRNVWAFLRNNNNLPSALSALVTTYNARWDTLYASYTAALATAGKAGSASTCTDTIFPIFTRDLRCWPALSYDTLSSLGKSETLSVPALTFRLIKPSTGSKIGSLNLTGLTGGVLVQKNGTGFSNLSQTGTSLSLFPSVDSSVLGLTVANSSFTPPSGQILLSTRSSTFTAFPNPVNLSTNSASFFAPAGVTGTVTLTVVSESGRRVAELPFNGAQASWSWDLKDGLGRTVPPGAYYYRIPGQPVKTLLILPN